MSLYFDWKAIDGHADEGGIPAKGTGTPPFVRVTTFAPVLWFAPSPNGRRAGVIIYSIRSGDDARSR